MRKRHIEEAGMLRITVISQTKEDVVLKVEGQVSGKDVALLEQEGTRWLRDGRCLVLDLSGVRFINRAGIELLQHWSGERIVLRDGSQFIRELLATHGID